VVALPELGLWVGFKDMDWVACFGCQDALVYSGWNEALGVVSGTCCWALEGLLRVG